MKATFSRRANLSGALGLPVTLRPSPNCFRPTPSQSVREANIGIRNRRSSNPQPSFELEVENCYVLNSKILRFKNLVTSRWYEIQVKSKRSVNFGRATEIFVFRNGKWLNPGWHTDNQ